jgi:hypothetical protein
MGWVRGPAPGIPAYKMRPRLLSVKRILAIGAHPKEREGATGEIQKPESRGSSQWLG